MAFNLRNLSIMGILIVIVFTSFSSWLTYSAAVYDIPVDPNTQKTFDNINESLGSMSDTSNQFQTSVEQVGRGKSPLNVILLIPAGVLSILLLLKNSLTTFINLFNEIKVYYPIPDFVTVGIVAVITVTVMFLIFDAIWRNKRT